MHDLLAAEIHQLDEEVKRLRRDHPMIERLHTIPGVGLFGALFLWRRSAVSSASVPIISWRPTLVSYLPPEVLVVRRPPMQLTDPVSRGSASGGGAKYTAAWESPRDARPNHPFMEELRVPRIQWADVYAHSETIR